MIIMNGPEHKVLARYDLDRNGSGEKCSGKTDTAKAIPVVWVVPVALRGAEVLWIVVPGTAAKNAETGGRSGSS